MKLFEFLCKLTDIQIKKYVGLATYGVGPDARLNASLVLDEVNELLALADSLLNNFNKDSQCTTDFFPNIFNQVKFFIEQEHLRAYAGWLLDENNIHSTSIKRLDEQLEELKEIAQLAKIDYSKASKPSTSIQKQCEYDSWNIALYILDIAIKVKANPEMDFEDKIPSHAQKILRRNATTRYCDEKFLQPITELHKQCVEFLNSSELKQSNAELQKDEAKKNEIIHREQFNKLLERYKQIEPSSELFSSKQEWYKIGTTSLSKTKSNSISSNIGLFGGVILIGGVLMCMLISYFNQFQNEHTLKPR